MALQRRFLATAVVAVVAVPVLLLAELTADEPAAGPPDSAGAPVSLNGVVEPLTVHQLRSATQQLGGVAGFPRCCARHSREPRPESRLA